MYFFIIFFTSFFFKALYFIHIILIIFSIVFSRINPRMWYIIIFFVFFFFFFFIFLFFLFCFCCCYCIIINITKSITFNKFNWSTKKFSTHKHFIHTFNIIKIPITNFHIKNTVFKHFTCIYYITYIPHMNKKYSRQPSSCYHKYWIGLILFFCFPSCNISYWTIIQRCNIFC